MMDAQPTNPIIMSIERLLAAVWNLTVSRCPKKHSSGPAVQLGYAMGENGITPKRAGIPLNRRAEHIVILGRTGTGKSSAMKHIAAQDIRAGRGFLWFDHHGDAIPFLLQVIRSEEERLNMISANEPY
jgi:DNA helicase HerA-like ATPase